MRKLATFNTKECNTLTGKKWKFSSALWQPKLTILFLQFLYARLYHTITYFFTYAQSWTALFRAFSSHRQPSAIEGRQDIAIFLHYYERFL